MRCGVGGKRDAAERKKHANALVRDGARKSGTDGALWLVGFAAEGAEFELGLWHHCFCAVTWRWDLAFGQVLSKGAASGLELDVALRDAGGHAFLRLIPL